MGHSGQFKKNDPKNKELGSIGGKIGGKITPGNFKNDPERAREMAIKGQEHPNSFKNNPERAREMALKAVAAKRLKKLNRLNGITDSQTS